MSYPWGVSVYVDKHIRIFRRKVDLMGLTLNTNVSPERITAWKSFLAYTADIGSIAGMDTRMAL